jgi:hypothetical protein
MSLAGLESAVPAGNLFRILASASFVTDVHSTVTSKTCKFEGCMYIFEVLNYNATLVITKSLSNDTYKSGLSFPLFIVKIQILNNFSSI